MAVLEVILNLVDNLSGGVDGASGAIDGLSDSVDGADGALEQLGGSAESADSAVGSIDPASIDDLEGSAESAGVSVSSIQEAAASAGSGIGGISSDPIKDTGKAAEEASGEMGLLAEAGGLVEAALGAIVGIAIVDYLSDATELAGNMADRWSRLNVTLGDSSTSVEDMQSRYGSSIAQMKSDTGRGMGAILDTMSQLGVSGVKNGDILADSFESISGAAFATNTPIESISSAFSKVVKTGKGFSRAMNTLGIDSQTVLEATGKSVEDLGKEFQDMTPEARAAMLNIIFQAKYGTRANEAYKNSWEHLNEALGRAWDGLARLVGDLILPILIPAMEALTGVIEWVASGFKLIPDSLKPAAGMLTLVGGAIVSLIGFLSSISTVLGALGISFMGLGTGASTLGIAAEVLGVALGPVGWAILAIIAIVTAAIYIWQNWSNEITAFKDALMSGNWDLVGKMIQNAFVYAGQSIYNFVVDGAKQIWNFVKNIPSMFSGAGASIWDFAVGALGAINNFTLWAHDAIWSFINAIPGMLGNMGSWLVDNGANMVEWLIQGLESMSGALDSILTDMLSETFENAGDTAADVAGEVGEKGGKGLIQRFEEWVEDKGPKMLDTFVKIFEKLLPLLMKVIGKLAMVVITYFMNKGKEAGKKYVDGIILWIKQLPGKFWTWLVKTLQNIGRFIVQAAQKAIKGGRDFVNGIINFIKTLPGRMWAWLLNTLAKISAFATSAYRYAINAGKNMVNGIINFIKTLPGRIWTWFLQTLSKIASFAKSAYTYAVNAGKSIVNGVISYVKGLPGKMYSWASSAISSFVKGIMDNMPSVNSALDSLRKILPNSPPKEGPLSKVTTKTWYNWTKSLADAGMKGLSTFDVDGVNTELSDLAILSNKTSTGKSCNGSVVVSNNQTNIKLEITHDFKNVPKNVDKDNLKKSVETVFNDPKVMRQIIKGLSQSKSEMKSNLGA